MFTAKITNKNFDKDRNQFVLNAEFVDGETIIPKELRYSADQSFDDIKKNIKQRVNRLNNAVTEESNIVVGDVDLDTVPDDTPTKAERGAQDWLRNFERLQKVQILIDLQVLTGNENQIQNLRARVASDFKPAYINLF